MKALIQRVTSAQVTVDGQLVGAIDGGLLAYIGIGHNDNIQSAQKLMDKIIQYRVFENEAGKLDKSLADVGGGLLLVSQFTLMARTDKGRRPDFTDAMAPAHAKQLFEAVVAYAQNIHPTVATGQFGANMTVSAVNDGPINFLIEVS